MSENKMTPTPWNIGRWKSNEEGGVNIEIDGNGVFEVAHIFGDDKNDLFNAIAIVSAVNNTYGKGIHPDAVEGLLVAANDLLRFESALQVMNDMLATPEPFFKILANLKAAIEKAKL